MKSAKMFTVLVLALSLMVWLAEVSEAAPMGTAFTYQGRLIDANDLADGLYDFQFKLFDDANTVTGNQVGSDVNKPDVDVIDGYFTVELDFGSAVFTGDARWLEIGVRPGEFEGRNAYVALSPLQEITPVPYALQTRGIFVDGAGNVGISTRAPREKLHVNGDIRVNNIRMSNSDITDNESIRMIIDLDNDQTDQTFSVWKDGPGGTELLRVQENGNVGIGTTIPGAKLDISGDVKVTGSVAASDAVIMATNTGSGDGVEGQSWGSSGRGVEGWALWSGPGANYGGYFLAEGNGGYGVYGYASNSGDYENYGGYFQAQGQSGIGAYGFVMGDNGQAIKGMAFDSGDVTNYGGHFTSRGASGRGVYGEASKTGAVENYGGYFTAAGDQGRGVYGKVDGTSGIGVYGYASNGGGGVTNYGGYFVADGYCGRGVYGEATTPTMAGCDNYGGYFTAAGHMGSGVYGESTGIQGHGVYGESRGFLGIGVYGEASNEGEAENYGGYFEAAGDEGTGVYGEGSRYGDVKNYGGYFTAMGDKGIGVYGAGSCYISNPNANYGGYFTANGQYGRGVYGEADGTYGVGVYGVASSGGNYTNYGGYFEAEGTTGQGVFGQATGSSGRGVQAWGGQYDFYAAGPGTNYGPFTGAHEVKLSDDFPKDVKPGMIVSVTGQTEVRQDEDGEVSISSTLPTVKLSEVANDKAVFGVLVAEAALDKDHWYQATETEQFATVNALGEGRVWVCDINGEIEAGDYITTSAIPGYGQKQYDNLLRSCTLGKAIETVDWDSVMESIEFNGQTIKIYLIAVVYTSG